MAQTIKLKRSATQNAVPTTSQLALGEVALNTYDGKMYIKKSVGGTESIVEIGGDATSSSGLDFTGNLNLEDNVRIVIGDGDDLQIYHDGSNSIIQESGTGDLKIQAQNLRLQDNDGTNFLYGVYNGRVELFHNNSKKFETTSSGISVTGNISGSGGLGVSGNITVGSSSSAVISLERASSNYILANNSGTGRLHIGAGSELVFLTGQSDGDYTQNEKIRIDADGRLLVNTTSSIDNLAKIQVVGDSSSLARITLQDVDGTNQKTFFEQSGGGTRISTQNGTSNGIFTIGAWDGTTSSDFVRVTSTGRVGIGTTAPSEKLHVDGNIRLQGTNSLVLNTNGSLKYSSSAGAVLLSNASSENVKIRTASSTNAGDIIFETNDVERIRILGSNGNVGIGTTAPDFSLDVKGSAGAYSAGDNIIGVFRSATDHATYLKVKNTNTNTTAGATRAGIDLDVANHADSARARAQFVLRSIAGSDVGGDTNISVPRDLRFLINNESTLTASSGEQASTSVVAGTEIMRIASTGKVGIGTTSPGTKLDVAGDITSSGIVNAGTHLNVNSSGNLLKVDISAWDSLGNNDQAILWNGYNSTIGDHIVLKAAGNGTTHGAIVVADGVFSYGSTTSAVSTSASLTAPLSSGTAFTVTSGGNAAFAGTLSSGNITSSGQIRGTNLRAINTAGYGQIEVGGASGGYVDLKKPDTDDYDVRIVSDAGTGGRIQSNGVFDIDAAGDITLDADGGDIHLKDNGASMASFTTAAATFAGTISSGNITTSGYLAGPATFTIDPAAVGDNTGTVVIAGNLQVDGTTTTINSTTLTVDDKNITLASGSTNAAAANGAGITVDCGSDTDATLTYHATGDRWELNKPLRWTYATATTALALNNNNIIEVNNIAFSDPGANEGLQWSNIKLFESPNDLTNASGNLQVTYGGTRRFTVSNTGASINGNLGVGTDSPLSKVDALGDGKFRGTADGAPVLKLGQHDNSATTPLVTVYTDDGGSTRPFGGDSLEFNFSRYGQQIGATRGSAAGGNVRSWKFGTTTNGDERGIDLFIYSQGDSSATGSTGTSTNVQISATSNRNSYINTSGNFGLGTNNPTSKLHLSGDDVNLTLDGTGAAGTPITSISLARGSVDWGIHSGIGGANLFGIKDNQNSAYRLAIDSSGNVGIGTTSPDTSLHVFSSGTTQAKFVRDLTTDVGLTIGNDSSGVVFSTIGVHNYQFYANGARRLNISSTGAATFNEAFTLPTTDGSANQVLKTDGSGNVTWATEAATSASTSISDADGDTKIQVEESSDEDVIRFDTAGSERMQIAASGKVGIGTTNPSSTLHVRTGTGQANIRVDSTDTNAAVFFANPSGNYGLWGFNDARLSLATNSTERMSIDGSGNVGIGTTSPSTKLHIQDNFDPDDGLGYVLIENTNTTSGGQQTNSALNVKNYHGTSQFMQWEENGLRIGSRVLTNSGVGNLYFTAGADSVKMFVKASNGYVGIGTTNPVQKLQVDGNIYANGGQFYVNNNSGLTAVGDMVLKTHNGSGYQTSMHLDGADNHVGIGTTSPSQKLTVRGATEFSVGDVSTKHATEFNWVKSNTGSSGNGVWYKVADISLSNVSYSAMSFEAYYETGLNNFGSHNYLDVREVFVSIVRNSTTSTNNSPDSATLRGRTSDIRVYKTAAGTYELQARHNSQNAKYAVRVRVFQTNGGTITPKMDGSTAGTTSGGTEYTVSEPGTTEGVRRYLADIDSSRIHLGNVDLYPSGNSAYVHLNGSGLLPPDTTTSNNGSLGTSSYLWNGVFSEKLTVEDGTEGAPAITFLNDTNTGICRTTSDQLRIVTGGTWRAYFESSGIHSSAHVYTASNGDFRNYGGEWHATAGTSGNGFKFTNTADSVDALTITSAGNGTFAGGLTVNDTLFIDYPDGGGASLKLGRNDSSNYWEVGHAGGDFRLYNTAGSGNDILFGVQNGGVDQGNKVGIGTATPDKKLTVDGDIKVGNGDAFMSANVAGSTRSLISLGTDNILRIKGNDAEGSGNVISMINGGKVGIGTTSPDEKLEVSGGVTSNFYAFNTAFSGSPSDSVYVVAPRSNNLGLFTTSTERLTVNGSGNVGIGTTSPTNRKLEVYHSTNGVAGILVENPNTGTNAYAGISFKNDAGGTTLPGVILNGSNQTAYAGANSLNVYQFNQNPIGFVTGNSLRMVVTGTGDVGIGTASPAQKLDIQDGFIRVQSPAVGGIATPVLTMGQVNNAYQAGITSTVHLSMKAANSAGNFYWYPNTNTPIMTLTQAGSLGIGTTSPVEKLSIGGGRDINFHIGGHKLITFCWAPGNSNNATVAGKPAEIRHEPSSGKLRFAVDGTSRSVGDTVSLTTILTLQNGRAGIGNDNPVAKLQVEELGIDTTTTTTSATTQVAIDTMAAATFRSAEFTIQVTNSTDSTYHLTKVLLIHDGTTPGITEYGTVFTGSAAEATFDADISSGNVRLLATPASTDSMTFKVVRHCITV